VTKRWDTLVIGGGQAGLAARQTLGARGIDHVVLEKDSVASKWRERWDSFTLVTPNWTVKLPGGTYDGPEPDGYLPRDEIVAHLERYAAEPGGDVVTGVEATAVNDADGGYRVETSHGPFHARNVIVATGTFQQPKRPEIGAVAPHIVEVHSSAYRKPDDLPPGGVLVIGSGQSGCQITEELVESGRRVYLSTGRAGRASRRYRGSDIFKWLEVIGYFQQPVEVLPSLAARQNANPHVSGKGGGRTLNLHRMASQGVTLLGRVTAVDGTRVQLADDRDTNVKGADDFSAWLRGQIDEAIASQGIDASDDDPADDYTGSDGFDQPEIRELDLAAEGISTVLWSAGYGYDYSWVKPATFDPTGYPIQRADYADTRGLYFLGMHFLHWRKSGIFYGVGEEAAAIADHIAR
jgi:putative flavoprotein involved in K+ transport